MRAAWGLGDAVVNSDMPDSAGTVSAQPSSPARVEREVTRAHSTSGAMTRSGQLARGCLVMKAATSAPLAVGSMSEPDLIEPRATQRSEGPAVVLTTMHQGTSR